jgi:hypothetical protein
MTIQNDTMKKIKPKTNPEKMYIKENDFILDFPIISGGLFALNISILY